MKGLLLEDLSLNYFTNLQDIFSVIEGTQNKYNWLITDYECNIYPSKKIPFNKEIVFLEGEKLSEIVTNYKIQFIWGVISGFKKDIALDNILEYPLPYVNENEEIWSTNICTQNPLADIEIIAWDSTLAIVISKDEEVIEMIKKFYPNAKDLLEYNLVLKQGAF